MDVAPGFPGNPLKEQDHEKRFRDCLAFAKEPIAEDKARQLVSLIRALENVDDVRSLVELLLMQARPGGGL
jgi:hypothetical protein